MMSRSAKKLAYGILWNILLAAVILAVYLVAVRPTPSCTDGVRNQGEEGTDCGGPCGTCTASNLVPIRAIRDAELFTTSAGKVTLFATVLNPNTGYGAAEFPYEFTVFDAKGNVLERLPGTDTLFASETRHLVSGAVETPAAKIAGVTLTLGTPQWKPRNELLRPDISVQSGTRTSVEESAVFVRGTVKNQSTTAAGSVRIVALLLDRSGSELFVSQTVLSRLAGGAETAFVVQFPADASIAARVDTDATRLTVMSR